MINKIILSILAFGLFTISTMQAQEKNDIDNNHEHVDTEKAIYTCSMHPEVKSDKPGECPKCGMKLIKMKEDQDKMAKTYTCSMHPEVKSDKPGECPKCGMKLIKMKEDHRMHKNKKHNH